MSQKVKERVMSLFNDLMRSYRKGRERFGAWWTIFTVSMLSMAVVFILFAMILAILYL